MNILNGINHFLLMVNENWTTIIVMLGLIVGIYQKIMRYISHSKEERVEIAKAQIKESILSIISKAELDFAEWNKAGSIKRSQVIQQIYADYPILSKVADQESVIDWIDAEINASLETLKSIIEGNNEADEKIALD